MQDKFGLPGKRLADFFVQSHCLPLLETQRFPLGQTGFHRKRRFRQIQGVFVVTHSVFDRILVLAKPGPRLLYIPRNVFLKFRH